MNRKGISQILFLIIAASVLMMVALTLIFMFQSGAGDTNQRAQQQTCISSVQTKCNSFGDQYVRMPSSCITTSDGSETMVSGVPFDPVTSGGGTITNLGTHTGGVYADCTNVN